jgi:hypothetical protein
MDCAHDPLMIMALVDGELADLMAEAIARQPKATWNPRIGVIQVTLAKEAA